MSTDDLMLEDPSPLEADPAHRCTVCQSVPYARASQLERLCRWQAGQIDRYANLSIRLELALDTATTDLAEMTAQRDLARQVAETANYRLARSNR